MISQKMQDALNKQINEEMFSSYLYLSIAAYFDSINLPGFAQWMKFQGQEEMFHAMKFYGHIVHRGGNVEFYTINEPKRHWESPLNAISESLDHERHISNCINNLMELAMEEKDFAAQNVLKWFVDEQVEEEDTFTEVLEKLKRIGDYEPLLLMQDNEMAQRQSTVNPFAREQAAE